MIRIFGKFSDGLIQGPKYFEHGARHPLAVAVR